MLIYALLCTCMCSVHTLHRHAVPCATSTKLLFSCSIACSFTAFANLFRVLFCDYVHALVFQLGSFLFISLSHTRYHFAAKLSVLLVCTRSIRSFAIFVLENSHLCIVLFFIWRMHSFSSFIIHFGRFFSSS